MNAKWTFVILCLLTSCGAFAQVASMESGLAELSTKLASQVSQQGKKKVTVLDFTDLQGNSSELGRYLAEQITVNLVLQQTNYAVLDRANLKSILAEHKLTATGLVAPENAKKLGQFAGVDALILGTIVSMDQTVELTAKIIATDTAVIAGAARIKFKADLPAQQLLSKPASEVKDADVGGQKSKFSKTFGDLRVEIKSLKIVNEKDFLLTLAFANQNQKKSIGVAIRTDVNDLRGTITDSRENEFQSRVNFVRGVEATPCQQGSFFFGTEVKPADSVTATIRFPAQNETASKGVSRVQLELLSGNLSNGNVGPAAIHNLICNIETD